MNKWKLGFEIFFILGFLLGLGSATHSHGQTQRVDPGSGTKQVFLFTAKRLGIPILKATIKIENGSSEQGKLLYLIYANIESLDYLKFLFRMNNRFLSTVEAETCSPVRYVKEINQQGLLVERKNYLQTLWFDYPNKKVVAEKKGSEGKQEYPLLSETLDPLSMFAKYYLKEVIHPGQPIQTTIFDGMKMRPMVFYTKKGMVKSKMYGEVEAICLESSTTFSSFEDQEGNIRIWFLANKEKIPILIELELPVGYIKFELESMERS